jgi:YHS domain-containing protein
VKHIALASALVLSLAAVACGGAAPAPEAPKTTAGEVKAPGEAKVGDKTTCLISKEEFTVSDSSPKVEHNGKTYYFCCSGCVAKFKSDPAKYLGGTKS